MLFRSMFNFDETKRTDMKNFEELKEKILTAAKAASACTEQYKRAYGTNSMVELCNVVKDNFRWCCLSGVLTGELIDEYNSDFSTNGIFHNENCDRVYLLATGNSTVTAYGNSTAATLMYTMNCIEDIFWGRMQGSEFLQLMCKDVQ